MAMALEYDGSPLMSFPKHPSQASRRKKLILRRCVFLFLLLIVSSQIYFARIFFIEKYMQALYFNQVDYIFLSEPVFQKAGFSITAASININNTGINNSNTGINISNTGINISNINPFEGWQPLPPPTSSNCSWRLCLKFPAKTDCRGFCLEQDIDLKPLPNVSQYPGDGSWVPDVEIVRRMFLRGVDGNGNIFPPPLDSTMCKPMGPNGELKDINKEMIDAVNIQLKTDADVRQPTRILCMVYTMVNAHANRIRAIRDTWAGRCDGFLAFSTASDPRLPAINLPHKGVEDYNNMWQKVRSIWKFVGEHYVNQFDYFHLGGDDMFVIPENLRAYLSTFESADNDHYFGRRFKQYGDRFKQYGDGHFFNTGGPGYTLSRGLLEKYYKVLDNVKCHPDARTSEEDVFMAVCLRNLFGVGLIDTRDGSKRERFHHLSLGEQFVYRASGTPGWYDDYNKPWGLLYGVDCCAPDLVSFHHVEKSSTARHLYKLLYDVEACPRPVNSTYNST